MFTQKLPLSRSVFIGRMNYQPCTGNVTPIRQRLQSEIPNKMRRFNGEKTISLGYAVERKSVNNRLDAIKASVKKDNATEVLKRLSPEILSKVDALRTFSISHTSLTATGILSRLPTRIPVNLRQTRLFVTKSDSHLDTGGNPNDTPQITLASKPPSGEVKIIKVDSLTQIKAVAQKLSNPKNAVHNFFSALADEMKDPAMKMSPTYKATGGKAASMSWVCCYHMKWPENIKVVACEASKQKASLLAARKVVDLLMTTGRLSPDGTPIFYNKADVKKINKQKRTAIHLDKPSITHMQNIVNIFNADMKQVVETAAEEAPADESSGFIAEDKQSAKLFMAREPYFLSSGQYFAKEKVSLPVSKLKY